MAKINFSRYAVGKGDKTIKEASKKAIRRRQEAQSTDSNQKAKAKKVKHV